MGKITTAARESTGSFANALIIGTVRCLRSSAPHVKNKYILQTCELAQLWGKSSCIIVTICQFVTPG